MIAMVGMLAATSFAQGGGGGGGGDGGGGTAKPPPNTPPPVAHVFPSLPAPVFTGGAGVADLHQFDMTGFIQVATVNGSMCPAGTTVSNYGGTVTVNGISIVVACNSMIQMPANTLTWANFVNPTNPSVPAGTTPLPVTSLEVQVVGNIVGAYAGGPQHVAGLIHLSQESLNQGQGIITRIDYASGNIHVGAKVGAADQAVIQINDPKGRFGRAQSPDPRFSVDDANPTIHAATGYPMCVPRTNPSVTDDALCPQKNRPKPAINHCRDWLDAGLANNMPKGQNLRPPFPGQVYCGHFVMPAATVPASATAPDALQQAPFEVGDYISYAGTLMKNASGGGYGISAYTIEAQVDIFTQPGTKPSYLSIGQFGGGHR
jgi:hypothetical protein